MKYLYFNKAGKLHLVSKKEIDSVMEFLIVKDDFDYQKEVTLQDESIVKIDMTKEEIEASLSYVDKRAVSYPKLEEQFDMLYKDLQDGTTTFIDAITFIKEKYPKVE